MEIERELLEEEVKIWYETQEHTIKKEDWIDADAEVKEVNKLLRRKIVINHLNNLTPSFDYFMDTTPAIRYRESDGLDDIKRSLDDSCLNWNMFASKALSKYAVLGGSTTLKSYGLIKRKSNDWDFVFTKESYDRFQKAAIKGDDILVHQSDTNSYVHGTKKGFFEPKTHASYSEIDAQSIGYLSLISDTSEKKSFFTFDIFLKEYGVDYTEDDVVEFNDIRMFNAINSIKEKIKFYKSYKKIRANQNQDFTFRRYQQIKCVYDIRCILEKLKEI